MRKKVAALSPALAMARTTPCEYSSGPYSGHWDAAEGPANKRVNRNIVEGKIILSISHHHRFAFADDQLLQY
jgi:hypothetical protein